MQYQRHKDRFGERIEILDKGSDIQLAKELFELHEVKCSECQEDRLSCTVRPACDNRNFLVALIELGISRADFPAFCYSVYLDQVRRFIIERKGRDMEDRHVPIKDLLSTLKVSSIRHFSTKYKEEWKRYSKVRAHDNMLVAGDGLLFHFDFARGIVTVNPNDDVIGDINLFKLYVELLADHYSVKTRASDSTLNWWVITIEATSSQSAKLNELVENLGSNFEGLYLKTVDNTIELQAEIISDGDAATITVGALHELFKNVGSLRKRKRTE